MKKMILSMLLLAFASIAVAQEPKSATENSRWLTEFTEVSISGPVVVVFEQIAEAEAPRIVYDTRGSYTSKFSVDVKDEILQISEKYEKNRTTVTEVRIYFHALDKIRISGATVSFATPLKASMMDLIVGGGALLTAPLEITDLKMDVSGKSRVVLTGEVRYLSLSVSTAKVDASQLNVMSFMADASNNAEVSLNVTERLAAKASTGARIRYAGSPSIVRSGVGFTGGEIVKAE